MQLDQLKYIDCSIRAAIQDKEIYLKTSFEMRQNFQKLVLNTEEKLVFARTKLQMLQSDTNPQDAKQTLLKNQVLFSSESEFLSIITELEISRDQLCGMDRNLTKTSRDTMIQQ